MIDTKICLRCGQQYERQSWSEAKRWARRQFCSPDCARLHPAGKSREFTPEHRANVVLANQRRIGEKHTPEHSAKVAAALRGRKRPPFSVEHRAKIGAANLGRKHSAEARARMSASKMGNKIALGHKLTTDTKRKISASLLGGKHSAETLAKMSGPNHYNWQGGKTAETIRRIRSARYKDNRATVYQRDGLICQLCEAQCVSPGESDMKRLKQCHHTGDPYDHRPEKLETLCTPCHSFLHSKLKTMPWGDAFTTSRGDWT